MKEVSIFGLTQHTILIVTITCVIWFYQFHTIM